MNKSLNEFRDRAAVITGGDARAERERRTVTRIAVAAAALAVILGLFFASFILVGETGEVVVLHTRTEHGRVHETRLWVVDADGAQWLRSGSQERGWAQRATHDSIVELERSGQRHRYRARPIRTAEAREMIDRLMREKYGLADRWATAFQPEGPLPFRLDLPTP